MARKKLIYTDQFPYHIYARSNNREWFYLPQERVWEIYISEINHIVTKFKVLIHAFVLMNNHYHMLITTHEESDLGKVMCELQKSVSRTINSESGRVNHVFGGPYKASLITTSEYYSMVYRYIFRNPVEAGICKCVEDYLFSTLRSDQIPVTSPLSGICSLLPMTALDHWLNEPSDENIRNSIRKGLKKTCFKPVISRD